VGDAFCTLSFYMGTLVGVGCASDVNEGWIDWEVIQIYASNDLWQAFI